MKPFRPTLPPKAGYVEVEIDGKRKYRRIETPETQEREQLQAEYDALILDQAFRLTLLELGVN